ncbi:MAG: AAA family ATPase [Anaerolineae bacterium]|nr:AAA family ATPase [Anaerolineae bacterium]
MPTMDLTVPVADNLSVLLGHLWQADLPRVFVIIDEYDNFANQLVTGHKDLLYRQLTAEDSFFKSFFKTLKEGRETGAIANVFITGVLPILIDELASGFNIATIITLDQEFEAMIGFTQREVDELLDEVYTDYALNPTTRTEVDTVIKHHYNGYHFANPQGEALYNSTILMYFLQHLTRYGAMPEFLTDLNLRTDLSWVRRLTNATAGDTEAFVGQLTTKNRIAGSVIGYSPLLGRDCQIPAPGTGSDDPVRAIGEYFVTLTIAYDRSLLATNFSTSRVFQPGFYPIFFFYLGMLTQQDNFFLRLPNLNIRQSFIEYFNELPQNN